MNISLIYTSTTQELIEVVEYEVRKAVGEDAIITSFQDPSILSEIRDFGYVTTTAAAKLASLYLQAIHANASAVLNVCSSVGETTDSLQDFAHYCGVPLVRIDEEMCREAVRSGNRIGILATLPTTLSPTKNTLLKIAREYGKHIDIVEGLFDAFNTNPDTFSELLLAKTAEIIDDVDVILLCQGSMAYCEPLLVKTYSKVILSSPRYGAVALKKILKCKGELSC